MGQGTALDGYRYADAQCNASHAYLLNRVRSILKGLGSEGGGGLFDLGCGNGSIAAAISADGWSVMGVDPSSEGIAAAKANFPHLCFEKGSAYDDLAGKYGRFRCVLSLEVVEHVYAPRAYAQTLFDLVEPGGYAIVSTPYHGYIKNLLMALSGKMDAHFTVLWDHGHIKFWSIRTLEQLLREAGFEKIHFQRVGRIAPVAKSMIAIAQRPPC